MEQFIQGTSYFIRAIRHLVTPGLKRFIVFPILFNFILFSALFYFIHHYIVEQAYLYVEKLPAWMSFLSQVFLILSLISFFLIFLSMFTVIFNLIAAPFNGLLAEKAQILLYQRTIPNLSFIQIALRSIKRQGQFLAYFFPRFIGMCLLFFVPFIQPVYPFLWFLFNAWMLSVQYQDFALDNNLVSFPDMKNQIHQNKLQTLGFGSIINLMSFMPVLNILTMPVAVMGGVIYCCEYYQRKDNIVLKIEQQSV